VQGSKIHLNLFFTRLRKKTKGKEKDYNLKKVPAALEDEPNLIMKSSH